ncbi:Lnb N-terminal periplasmic domain-containing protein [Moraxella marmotae]|uniref:Lnb N-terminal periplasmic domain-containing protein n=1 Tax=Moraxella marmotae TaxID=3344520 RepID=UPI0035F451C5
MSGKQMGKFGGFGQSTAAKKLLACLMLSVIATPAFATNGITDGTQLSGSIRQLSMLATLDNGTFANANADTDGSADFVQFEKANQISQVNQTSQINQADKTANPFGLTDTALQQISSSVGWRRLLLFGDKPKSNDKSSLNNPKFFLSKQGQHDAHAELVAMLTAMQNHDTDAVCRFVARTHFLNQILADYGIDSGTSDVLCGEFEQFAKRLNAKRLSLIFAEENPNHIASAFAHTLLRADDGKDDTQATAINYTISSNPADNAAAAAIKSLSGGYFGVMEILPYQQKADDYLIKNERDLWQFSLNLTADEVAQIVRHIWEVKDMARPYFFTHDNCATEIVRLIDVVRPQGSMRAKVGKIVIPSRIASILSEQGVISRQQYLPSASSIRQAKLNNGNDFDMLNLIPSHNNPIDATPVHRIGVGIGMDNRYQNRTVYGVQLNAAYQDLLDNPNGVRPLLDLQLLSLDAIYDDEKAKIKDLTIFATRSLNPSNTAKNNAMADKKGRASGMRLKFTQVTDASDTANDDHLVLDVGMQKGKAWTLGQAAKNSGEIADTTCYALANGGVQLGRINQGYRIGVGANLGCVHYATHRLRGVLELSLPYYYHPDNQAGVRSGYWQPAVSVGVQADISRDYAIRATAKREWANAQNSTQAMIALQRYF